MNCIIVQLENKIQELEAKILFLSDELNRYKHKTFLYATGEERDFNDFLNVRNYFKTEFTTLVNEGDEQKVFERFFEIQKLYGPKGTDRQKIIKKWFRRIIELMVADEVKFFLHFAEEAEDTPDWDYNKLFKQSKSIALTTINQPDFNNFDKLLFEMNMSCGARSIFLNPFIK